MNDEIGFREQEIEGLFRAAIGYQEQGDPQRAERTARKALDALAELSALRVAPEAVDLRMDGGLRYLLGGLCTEQGLPDEAVAVLDEAEQSYREFGRQGGEEIEPLLADVWIRRARARALAGQGLRAVDDADRAVQRYMALVADHLVPPTELGRVLAPAALVFARYADPAVGRRAAVAALNLGAGLRLPEADAALGLADEPGALTLVQALQHAHRLGHGSAELSETFAVPKPPVCPGDRMDPVTGALYAKALARLAAEVTTEAPEVGLRLGLEAHHLFAAARRAGSPLLGEQDHRSFEQAWLAALHACCAVCVQRPGEAAMARDLSDAAAELTRRLRPHVESDPGLYQLVRESLLQRGNLLIAQGEVTEGDQVLAAARDLLPGAAGAAEPAAGPIGEPPADGNSAVLQTVGPFADRVDALARTWSANRPARRGVLRRRRPDPWLVDGRAFFAVYCWYLDQHRRKRPIAPLTEEYVEQAYQALGGERGWTTLLNTRVRCACHGERWSAENIRICLGCLRYLCVEHPRVCGPRCDGEVVG